MKFMTWTQFEIPDDVLFYIRNPWEFNPEYDPRLMHAIRPLLHATGHQHSSWGRVKERPQKIILVSTWDSEDSFTAFKATPEYLQYWSCLSKISSVPLHEQRLGLGVGLRPNSLNANIDIFSISVPSPVSDDTRAQLLGLKGMQNSASLGFDMAHLSPYARLPTKHWFLDAHALDNTEVETMLLICWWGGGENEREFKERLWSGGQTAMEKFECSRRWSCLDERGALQTHTGFRLWRGRGINGLDHSAESLFTLLSSD